MSGQRVLAAFAAAPGIDLAAERPAAARAFLDTIGCCVAGRGAPSTRAAVRAVKQLDGRPLADTAPDRQALVLGVAAHALDYDDVLEPANAHASAVLVPAALATAARVGATVGDALDAFTVGYVVLHALGRAFNPRHYAAGWHATSTLGVVAAAATSGVLLGLDGDRMAHALGLSTSLSSGLKAQFGFGAKHLHAGQAAAGGVLAAHLAAAGLTAAPDALTGPGGLADRYDAAGATLDGFEPAVGTPSKNLWLKSRPSCAATHRPLAAAAALAGGPRDDVDVVTVHVAEISRRSLTIGYPDGPMPARFSLEFCLAVLLTTGSLTLADFTDERLTDPRIRALADRITVAADPAQATSADSALAEETATVEIRFADGRTDRSVCAFPPGHPRAPLSDAAVLTKFRDCLAFSGATEGGLTALVRPEAAGRPAVSVHDEVVLWMT